MKFKVYLPMMSACIDRQTSRYIYIARTLTFAAHTYNTIFFFWKANFSLLLPNAIEQYNSLSEFRCYAQHARTDVPGTGSISFLSDEEPPVCANSIVILHSMDSFLKRPVGMRLERIAKKAEKSRAVSDTQSSVMKIALRLVYASRLVIKIMSVARKADALSKIVVIQKTREFFTSLTYTPQGWCHRSRWYHYTDINCTDNIEIR